MSDGKDFRSVLLEHEPVELYKILKFEGLVESGAQAKQVIDEGLVRVNGDVETRRRRKIVSGDIVEFEDHQLRPVLQTGRAS